ncbi:hypothetical protein DFP73DRAFT_470835 [Morchella snyderi]|nr:hypothetical protein DFP73DRAFT_470835 [Morchella snyderi]
MVYYQRPQSPHRDEDPYYSSNSNNNNNSSSSISNNNTYRGAPVDVRDSNRDRDRDRDRDYHRSRRSSYSPARGRSLPHDAPKAPRAYHGPSSSYRSRSDSHDRMSGRGGNSGSGGYYDRDAPRDRSRSRDDREWLGGPASRDVIIEGLGADVDEDYIMRGLQDGLQVENVEKVTIIRDRKTGNSRQFAFVHFYSVPDARAFLQQYYPNKLNLGPGTDRCKVAFSKERDNEDGRRGRRRDDGEEEWKCRVCLLLNFPRRQECFRCQTPRSEVTLTGTLTHPTPTHFTNDGERDMATSPPSQFLLFRGLEPSVTEELLAKGALKLTVLPGTTPEPSRAGPIGAKESSVKRVLLVRDRKTDESWRYGFVEFATALDAQAALAAYNKMEKFTISSRPVTASYIHPGVFVPVYNASRGVERFTFLPMTANVGGGLRLAYWDDDGYVSEFIVSKPEQEPAAAADGATADSKKATADSRKATKGTKDATDDKAKTKKRKADKDATASTVAPGISAASTSKKATPAHLQFWQNRHSELHGIKPDTTTTTAAANNTAESTTGSTSGDDEKTSSAGGSAPKKRRTAEPADEPPRESFADMNKLACLLCSRVFKTPEKVHEHERVSTLHASNVKDPALREAALKKLAKAGITTAGAASATPEYRDRAKERRQVFGKSAPAGASAGAGAGAAKKESPQPEAEVVVAQSKGAALLGKMGWTSGQGLGASGEGRTEHVVAEMYTQGAGLGMKGARVGDVEEAAKGGGSYSEFVKKTKERALERYKGMD